MLEDKLPIVAPSHESWRRSSRVLRSSKLALGALTSLTVMLCLSDPLASSVATQFLPRGFEATEAAASDSYYPSPAHSMFQRTFGRFRSQQSLSSVPDPYRQLGYMRWSSNITENRWIPYDSSKLLDEDPQDPYSDLSEEDLARAAPAYNRMATILDAADIDELQFMRNKHVVLSCDSHCHGIVHGFCLHHLGAGAQYQWQMHNYTVCKLPALNFTMSNWFHYGVASEEEGKWSGLIGSHKGSLQYENRIDKFFMQERVPLDGPPDFIVFDSAYWDSEFFGARAMHFDPSTPYPNMRDEGLLVPELKRHRKRIVEIIGHLQARFPDAAIMYKPAHPRARSTHTPGATFETTAFHELEQINQSTRALMKVLGIPVLEWAAKVQGFSAYHDFIHWTADSAPNWLAADMILYYLRRAVLKIPLE